MSQAMSYDPLNYEQLTPNQLRRRVKMFKESVFFEGYAQARGMNLELHKDAKRIRYVSIISVIQVSWRAKIYSKTIREF